MADVRGEELEEADWEAEVEELEEVVQLQEALKVEEFVEDDLELGEVEV